MLGSIDDIIKGSDPVSRLYEQEFNNNLLSFCTFICLLFNKRMNLPNIFIVLLKHDDIRATFKKLIEIDNDYEVYKLFLEYDPSLYKSKYIKKYINAL
jgi:hypothetical protein